MFAAVARASWRARLPWWSEFQVEYVSRVFSRLPDVLTEVKGPKECNLPRAGILLSEASLDVARNRFTALAQTDCQTSVWGANSSAVEPVHVGSANPQVGEQSGHCMPAPMVAKSPKGPGIWLAVACQDATLAAPGVSRGERCEIVTDGKPCNLPRFTKSCATLLGVFELGFGQRCEDPGARDAFCSSALRFSEQHVPEAVYKRCGGRATAERPRAASRFLRISRSAERAKRGAHAKPSRVIC